MRHPTQFPEPAAPTHIHYIARPPLNRRSVLRESDRCDIAWQYAFSRVTNAELAARYGVSSPTICAAKRDHRACIAAGRFCVDCDETEAEDVGRVEPFEDGRFVIDADGQFHFAEHD